SAAIDTLSLHDALPILLLLALGCKRYLMGWREWGGAGRPGAPPAESSRRPIPGNPFSGFTRLLRSPYLAGIAGFVVLLATTTTRSEEHTSELQSRENLV